VISNEVTWAPMSEAKTCEKVLCWFVGIIIIPESNEQLHLVSEPCFSLVPHSSRTNQVEVCWHVKPWVLTRTKSNQGYKGDKSQTRSDS